MVGSGYILKEESKGLLRNQMWGMIERREYRKTKLFVLSTCNNGFVDYLVIFMNYLSLLKISQNLVA